MRVLPHHQDTGGFFIAVLEKREWLPWQRKQKRTQNLKDEKMTSDVATSGEDKMEVAPGVEDETVKENLVEGPARDREDLTSQDLPVEKVQDTTQHIDQATATIGEEEKSDIQSSESGAGVAGEVAADRTSVDTVCAVGGESTVDAACAVSRESTGGGGTAVEGEGKTVEETRPSEAVFGK